VQTIAKLDLQEKEAVGAEVRAAKPASGAANRTAGESGACSVLKAGRTTVSVVGETLDILGER